jgi:bifunctional aspartokinase / homoserine dehydrogenase 1
MAQKARAPEVYKFGGASLSDGAAFKHAATIVERCSSPLIVVCSAPAGATDLLLEVADRARAGDQARVKVVIAALGDKYTSILRTLAPPARVRQSLAGAIGAALAELETLAGGLAVLRELTPRTSDLVVSRGERLGARLFAAALVARGIRAEYVDALEVVVTEGPFGGAAPNLEATDRAARRRLRPLLAAGLVPVVPGFLGAYADDPEHAPAVATLGRGGSDLTATLLGRALGALRVSLWKDVPGLLTADPRVVPDARIIPQLNVREAAELAYYGAKVLHPRALIPLAGRETPLFVRPFTHPEQDGTEISSRHTLDEYPVKALSAMGGQALVTVAGRGLIGVPGVAARTFATLSARRMSVSLITQSSSEQSICFTVPEREARQARALLEQAFKEEIGRREVDSIQVQPGTATVAVVGLGMAGTPGIAARVFASLAAADINLVAIAQGSSELNISFVVKAGEVAAAQRAIHQAFQLSKIGGGRVSRGETVDLVLLGYGQIGRTLAGLIGRRKNNAAGNGNGNGRNEAHVRIVGLVDRTGFVFDAQGLSPRRLAELGAWKEGGRPFATASGGHTASPADAIAFFARHALSHPVLVDVTADETGAVLTSALQAGMDLVLANKRPLSGPRADRDYLLAVAEAHGRRVRFEATVGAGLPILDTYRKLVESGDRVLKIEGCVSGTLGFLLTEISRGRPFSQALRAAIERGYTEPDPRDDLSGADVGRKALILGRLLGFPGEPEDVAVETLVPVEARELAKEEFLQRLETWDRDWERRVVSARAKQQVLRYVATVTKSRIRVGLQTVDTSSPFAALKGTDNQIAFTTTRYRSPLVIRGAGAGPAVTAGGVLNDLLELVRGTGSSPQTSENEGHLAAGAHSRNRAENHRR